MRKCATVLALVLGLVSFVGAQAPPERKADKPAEKPAAAPAIDPAVQKLVDQLADLDFHRRDEATRQLEALGEKALPALRAARKHSDAEVRRRAADLLGPMEAATVLAPKRVTLTLTKKTAAEAIAAIATKTGYAIDVRTPAGRAGKPAEQFDFRWKETPFWQAVDEVCRAGGLAVQQNFGDGPLLLTADDRYAPYVSQAGAFCLTAGGFQQTRTVDFSAFPRSNPQVTRSDDLVFAFFVHAEPRLPLLSVGEPRVTAAYDSDDNSLIPPSVAARDQPNPQLFGYRPGRAYYGGNRMLTLAAQANLVRPSLKSASVKQIKGTLPLTILLERKPAVVAENLPEAKGKKLKAGTTTFAVEDVSETSTKQMQVRLSITEEAAAGAANDYTWMNTMWSRIETYDEKGNRVHHQGGSMSLNGPSHGTMTLTFAAGTKPSKLVYQVWTTMSNEIAFEFKGLPLP
jgi:hypothetical protein